jgi:hypothetical protein
MPSTQYVKGPENMEKRISVLSLGDIATFRLQTSQREKPVQHTTGPSFTKET